MAGNATAAAFVGSTMALPARPRVNASPTTASMASVAATSVPARVKHARRRKKAAGPTAYVGPLLQVTIRTTNVIPVFAMVSTAVRSLKSKVPMVRHARWPRNAPRVGASTAFAATALVQRRASPAPQQRKVKARTARVAIS